MRKTLIATALCLAASTALAQGPGYGPGYGPGMMGGYGPGYGYGPGMMRGYGDGPAALNLTQEQSDKIAAIQEDNRRKNWDTMGQLRSEMFTLRRMYNGDIIDPKAFSEQQKKVDDLRRQMTTSHLESRKQIDSVLTPEQRKQFKRFGPWWLGDEDGG
ncbi:MAG: Spy/CpxP family protein refolding chaperone [Acidobacteriia bacterium]|nr:Spy/CpxP family protein refolding chaperone [Terriglobia bacterium]